MSDGFNYNNYNPSFPHKDSYAAERNPVGDKEAPSAKQPASVAQNQQVSPEKVLGSLDLVAQYNKTQIVNRIIDPAKYLTPDRIKDIEDSMVKFRCGTDEHRAALEEEFGHLNEFSVLSEQDKLAMAAQSYVHNA